MQVLKPKYNKTKKKENYLTRFNSHARDFGAKKIKFNRPLK